MGRLESLYIKHAKKKREKESGSLRTKSEGSEAFQNRIC